MYFSPKQTRVLTWWNSSRFDAIVCDGSVRSGKTFSMGLSFFLWAERNFNGRQFGICGKTVTSIRRNLLAELLPYLAKLGMTVRECRADNSLRVRFNGHTNSFLLFGGRDESSAALIQGSTLAGVLLDEAALMPRSFVEQAVARCSVRGSRLWFNCNPENQQHWFYQEWILKARERRALHLHFSMDDNPSLSPEIRERYKRSYSGVFYRRFVLGEWCAAQGLVYDFFDSVSDPVDPPPDEDFCAWRVSVDYGTVNPASFGLWGKFGQSWIRVREFYYDSKKTGRQKTDEEYADDLLRLVGNRKIERVVADPSASSFIETLRRRGLPVVRADNDVGDGIRVTAGLLRNHKLLIGRNCADFLREIDGYCWDERGGRDVPRKINDHAMDDLRYFAMDVAGGDCSSFAAACVRR